MHTVSPKGDISTIIKVTIPQKEIKIIIQSIIYIFPFHCIPLHCIFSHEELKGEICTITERWNILLLHIKNKNYVFHSASECWWGIKCPLPWIKIYQHKHKHLKAETFNGKWRECVTRANWIFDDCIRRLRKTQKLCAHQTPRQSILKSRLTFWLYLLIYHTQAAMKIFPQKIVVPQGY